MPLQIEHPLAEAVHVVHQLRHLALDEVRLLAHLHVLQDRLHGLHREHQHVRRADDDARAMRLLHQVGEMLGEIGIDRLRRHEQDRRVLRLAGDEITLGHGIDMAADIDAHPPRRFLLVLIAPRDAKRLEAFQRKLGVDHHGSRAVGHMQQAVRPLAVGERRLERVGALGQAVLDDGLHAHLAERAARLLVGKDLLQARPCCSRGRSGSSARCRSPPAARSAWRSTHASCARSR